MATVQWAHLCDHAFYDEGGKPCLVGIFGHIHAPRVPAQHTHACLAFSVRGMRGETIPIRINIVRPDKGELLDLPNRPVTMQHDEDHNFIIHLDNLTLPDFGPYEVNIFLYDQVAATLRFTVSPLRGR